MLSFDATSLPAASNSWSVGPLLTGGAIAIFAFLLARAWDMLKAHRERRRRDLAVLRAADAEISSLSTIAINDRNIVIMELRQLDKGTAAGLTNPLDPIPSGFWDLVKVDPPSALLKDEQALATVRDVARRTDQVTEMIRSREAFRIANRTLPQYPAELRQYDDLLNTFLTQLVAALSALSPVLREAASPTASTARVPARLLGGSL